MDVKFHLGELFSGAGGLALGAKLASARVNGTGYSISHYLAVKSR